MKLKGDEKLIEMLRALPKKLQLRILRPAIKQALKELKGGRTK